MGDVSKYFSRHEFACRCGCGFAAVDVELLEILRYLRITFKKPLHINSACRCEKHNKEVGGQPDSYHIKGMAADIVIQDVTPLEIAAMISLMYPDRLGVIQYNNFIHVDLRKEKYRKEMD